MNRKWNERTKVEKAAEIISTIALCVWLAFEWLGRTKAVGYADVASCISVVVICLCQAVSLWKVKRALSYVAIAGVVLLSVVITLILL